MIVRLAHVCLKVSNLNNTIDFYHKKLGLPIKFTFEKEGNVFGVYFEVGKDSYIEAFEQKEKTEGVSNVGLAHFCLQTDNIDGFIKEMESKGVECSKKKIGCDQSWQTWLKDPDGNDFEIHEYTSKSAQHIGGVVQANF